MKKTVVIGLGMSGRAAVRYLLSKGKYVIGVDRNPHQFSQIEPSDRLTLCLESDFDPNDTIEEVVLSSGVRPNHPLARQFPVVGEAELVLRNCHQKCIGITGTNGKTTVTLLVEHILNHSGRLARALGNIGIPLADYFLSPCSEEILVIELSSYQLETLSSPVFDVATILNITPDHLDQYGSMQEYAQAKCRLQSCLKKGASLFAHEKVMQEYNHFLSPSELYPFQNGKMAPLLPERYRKGHECENIFAAWEMVKPFGVTWKQCLTALETFTKPPHRIEFVAEIEGVTYFDDSKGTNVDAVIQAVKTMTGPVLLIAGGVDKGSSYLTWVPLFTEKVKKIFAIGEAAAKMKRELSSYCEVALYASLDEAVESAKAEAKQGDSILLSPGCASFDMFRDYAHRGEEFKRCVQNLRRKP